MEEQRGNELLLHLYLDDAVITIDRFHVQKDCCDAMQQLRVRHRREAQRAEVEARE